MSNNNITENIKIYCRVRPLLASELTEYKGNHIHIHIYFLNIIIYIIIYIYMKQYNYQL